jgi:asparagine synthase (glutamine-hydrolysing)
VRRKKRGFAVNVVDDWFRTSMAGEMEEQFRDSRSLAYRFLNHDTVAQLLRDHQSGRHDNHKILFSLVVFEKWLRNAAESVASS